MSNNLPIATQWTLNATAALPSQVVLSVALVASTSTGQKGTGWLVSNRHIVTNEHVVRGASTISVLVQFSDGVVVPIQGINVDQLTDLAVLTLQQQVSHLPLKIDSAIPDIGTRVCAWGHPLGNNGPQPILSVGMLLVSTRNNRKACSLHSADLFSTLRKTRVTQVTYLRMG